MEKRVKQGLIVLGYIFIILLIFITFGGLVLLIEIIKEVQGISEDMIIRFIEFVEGII